MDSLKTLLLSDRSWPDARACDTCQPAPVGIRKPAPALELSWKELCRDFSPSNWCDSPNGNISPRYPHSNKPMVTAESLWLDQDHYAAELKESVTCLPLPVAIQVEGATFVASLRACTKNKDLYTGTKLHDQILKRGLLEKCSDALVTMYAKCGELGKASALLDVYKSRDVITWTALVAGYVREGRAQQALDCFEHMQQEGIPPNAVTYSCILKACASVRALEKGKEIHDEILRQGLLQDDVVLATSLLDMYGKCGALSKAQNVLEKFHLRDLVSWNALIAGHAQEGQGEQALSCFERMKCEGIPPNTVTYISILKACATIGAADKGKQIHEEVVRQGLLQDNPVLGSALVNMYAKCSTSSKAHYVFEKLPARNAILWNTLITGFVQKGQGEEALDCFDRMQQEAIPPDAVTYACILKACTTIGDVDKGEELHAEIARQGLLQNNIVLGNVLVDMYAKCGALSKAQDVLEKLPFRNVVSWSTLIAGYTQNGKGELALQCFACMQHEGIPPDAVTLVCVLNACSHLGLVEEGHALFVNMLTRYGIEPNLECYSCMVDLYGRAGHIEKAVQFVHKMPSSDYCGIWLSLLGACFKWGNVEVGRWAFDRVVKLDKSSGPAYVLMANIYAAAGMQKKAKGIEGMRIKNKAWQRPPGSCWSLSSGEIHAFSTENTLFAEGSIST